MRNETFKAVCGSMGMLIMLSAAAFAQESKSGRLKITVSPKQAYTFVDGKAIGPGNRTVKLGLGTHHLVVANYGYKFFEQDVSIDSDKTIPVKVDLVSAGSAVAGPRGRIQIEVGTLRAGDAAVLLNGKKPEYFVGHVDEFNHDILLHQELVVPPGTHQITVTRYDKELWSGPVTVAANQRVILDISNGKQKIRDWPRGSTQLGEAIPRFYAGIASATIAVAPVGGTVSATPPRIDCSQPTQLAWTSGETIDADMSGFSPVPTTGEKTISPRQTTAYQLTATGPGGVTKPSATVEVNPVVQSTLSASPAEIRYRRIGDKVIEQGSSTLNWSSSNSDSIRLTSFGAVDANGSQLISPAPKQTTDGLVEEDASYILTATNVCGGSEVKTVAVRIKGSIEPIPAVLLKSVFYPTDYPDRHNPDLGLLGSQREALTTLASGFVKYLEYDPGAKLSLVAHADPRGGAKYNESLSLRRAELTKQFLVSQGISSEKIDSGSEGTGNALDDQNVSQLEALNPNPLPAARAAQKSTTLFAYQRRVDIVLTPTNAESVRYYPSGASDLPILWQRPKPSRNAVKRSQ
jgi:OmpA family protein/PEGA domain-containing protein